METHSQYLKLNMTKGETEMTLKVSIEKVTPLVATKLLEGNTNNYRKLNNATVDRYANLMKQGKWVTEACMIVLAEDGTLVNGQHRLTAVQKAQLAIDMIVVTGASISSKDVIDSHMPRRMKDHCQCDAYKISMINTFLRSEGLIKTYGKDVDFFRSHVNGDIGALSEKMHKIYSKTYSPFTSTGIRAGLILAVINNQMTEESALAVFQKLSNLRKKVKKKDNTSDYFCALSTRSSIISTLDPLMSKLVDYLDNDELPVQSPVANSNSWYTESYDGAREKASKLMKATYLAVCKDTKNDSKFKGALTVQIRKTLGV
jgi:hypothetical protein